MTTTHCGDSCGLIDFTMAVAGDRLLPEERMKLAIEAVTSEKMSAKGASAKYSVARTSLRRALEGGGQTATPAETQPTTEVLADPVPATQPEKLKSGEVRSRLRALLRQHDAPKGIGGKDGISSPQARGWLEFAGIPIPLELQGSSIPFNPSNESHDPANAQGLSANNHVPAQQCNRTGKGTAFADDDPIYADELDIDAVRDHVCAEVQLSNRPADFKRAIDLLRELDSICTDAWYRRHPEPWNHHDWAHVNSELKTIQSLVGQRAQETADQLLFPGSAVTVSATSVA